MEGAKPIESDYYKWSHQISESKKEFERLGGDISPTKIESTLPAENSTTTGISRSVWNKAGTWEERDCTKWAKERIREIITGAQLTHGDFAISFESVEKCDGQATIVFSKGKKKPGFDFSLKIKWNAQKADEEESATGFVHIEEFSTISEGDYEWSFKASKSDALHTKAKAAVQSSKKEILKLLDKWIAEFKEF